MILIKRSKKNGGIFINKAIEIFKSKKLFIKDKDNFSIYSCILSNDTKSYVIFHKMEES